MLRVETVSRVGEGSGYASERGVVHRKRAGQEACKSVGRASQLVTSQVPPGQLERSRPHECVKRPQQQQTPD